MVLLFKSGTVLQSLETVWLPRPLNLDWIVGFDVAFRNHPGEDAAPARVNLLRDPDEPAIQKRAPNLVAGGREGRDFEHHLLPDLEPDPGHYRLPADTSDGQIFSNAPDLNRVTLFLEVLNPLE